MDDLTPEQLEAILGTDYETVLADILRQKASAEERRNQQAEIGQVGDGNVFFDPAGAINNVMNRRRAGKDAAAAQTRMDEVLAQQKAGRRTFAEALGQKPQPAVAPNADPMAQTVERGPSPMPMAAGAPPALSNARTMPPDRLTAAGVPPDVMAMLAKLRGQQ